nr:mitochondrial substrate carrier family protein V isoform X1 [Ipomoea batatas]
MPAACWVVETCPLVGWLTIRCPRRCVIVADVVMARVNALATALDDSRGLFTFRNGRWIMIHVAVALPFLGVFSTFCDKMAWGHQPPKGDKVSTKYRCNLLEGAFFELADSDRENYATISSENKKQNNKIAERKPPEIMTTRELISAVGNIWNSAAHPLSFILFQCKFCSQKCSSSIQNHEFGDCSLGNISSSSTNGCAFRDATSCSGNLSTGNTDCHTDIKPTSSLSSHDLNLHKSSSSSSSALCSKNGNELFHVLEPNAFQMSSSEVHGYSSEKHSTSEYCACDETKYENRSDSGLDDYGPNQQFGGIECNSESEIGVVAKEKPCHALEKQDNMHSQEQWLVYWGFIVEFLAILLLQRQYLPFYTFTYESVKGALLPFLHTEYQSVAHCVAGVVQVLLLLSFSLQVSASNNRCKFIHNIKTAEEVDCLHYMLGGELFSAAMFHTQLSRVFHFIDFIIDLQFDLQFYTYESLKQLMSSSLQFDIQNKTLMTVPGSNQYDGVLHTLKEIGKSEGLKGLYRGLTPRLVMYMTQGALFFASYESFKRLFSLDLHQSSAHKGLIMNHVLEMIVHYHLSKNEELEEISANPSGVAPISGMGWMGRLKKSACGFLLDPVLKSEFIDIDEDLFSSLLGSYPHRNYTTHQQFQTRKL